jgi:hypothetical protein
MLDLKARQKFGLNIEQMFWQKFRQKVRQKVGPSTGQNVWLKVKQNV